jgi:hypothetical protein
MYFFYFDVMLFADKPPAIIEPIVCLFIIECMLLFSLQDFHFGNN